MNGPALFVFYRYSITKFGMVFGIAFAEWDLRFKSDFDFWRAWRTLVLSHSAFGIRRSIHRWICNFIFVDWTLVDGSHDLNTHAVGCSHNRHFFQTLKKLEYSHVCRSNKKQSQHVEPRPRAKLRFYRRHRATISWIGWSVFILCRLLPAAELPWLTCDAILSLAAPHERNNNQAPTKNRIEWYR